MISNTQHDLFELTSVEVFFSAGQANCYCVLTILKVYLWLCLWPSVCIPSWTPCPRRGEQPRQHRAIEGKWKWGEGKGLTSTLTTLPFSKHVHLPQWHWKTKGHTIQHAPTSCGEAGGMCLDIKSPAGAWISTPVASVKIAQLTTKPRVPDEKGILDTPYRLLLCTRYEPINIDTRLVSSIWRIWKTIGTGGLIRIQLRFALHTSEVNEAARKGLVDI